MTAHNTFDGYHFDTKPTNNDNRSQAVHHTLALVFSKHQHLPIRKLLLTTGPFSSSTVSPQETQYADHGKPQVERMHAEGTTGQ